MLPSRRPLVAGGVAVAAALALAACSAGSPSTEAAASEVSGSTTVTFRLWDDAAARAYAESFDAFTAANPDIRVEVEVVPWAGYWERLPRDISSGDMADIFWTDTSNFGRYADSGDLIDISTALGDDHDEWEESVVRLYTRDGSLWGVPQLWDSVALYYNTALVEGAGVDPEDLTWAPPSSDDEEVGARDTLLDAARALTTDTQGHHPGEDGFDVGSTQTYGFNSEADLQAVCVEFLAQNGAQFQDGGTFAFAGPEGEEAFGYLVDLINTHHVAPPAADTNTDGDLSRDLFLRGRLGLFQSGPSDLRTIADDADFEWGLAPMVAGPEGRIGVVRGVAAVGNARTENPAAATTVLRWLGSADGQKALAGQGVALPGAVGAQQTYIDYWAARDVDVQVFLDAAKKPTAPAAVGRDGHAAVEAITPILQEMFLGAVPVPEALARAQQAGNEAIAK